ncbi:asparaginase domain-containing protein [Shigella flexneri]
MQRNQFTSPTQQDHRDAAFRAGLYSGVRSSTTPTGADAEFHRPEMPDFTIHEYTPLMDSSDMSRKTGSILLKILKRRYDDYDGFVILHGTDTMAIPPLRCRSCRQSR